MFLDQRDTAKNAGVKGGVHTIELGIAAYANDNGDLYPGVTAVDQAGAAGAQGRQVAEELVDNGVHTAGYRPRGLHVPTGTGEDEFLARRSHDER